MEENKIPYKIVDGLTVEETSINAEKLLPLLEKSNSFGLGKFNELINF
jgi:hypothetical protein